MARTVRDANLETRTARSRLRPQGKPYYRSLEPGVHLGYRKPATGAGKWVVRFYTGGRTYQIQTIAVADDFSDADGVAILSYRDAQKSARQGMVSRAHHAAGKSGPLTVGVIMDSYLDFLDANRKSGKDARYRDRAFIRPTFGNLEVSSLTTERIRRWHASLAQLPARVRTKAGEKQRHREVVATEEIKRRRRASANRTMTILKAALNRAWREGLVASDDAWRRVEPFENVDAARIQHLTITEAQRLIRACDNDFRELVQAALQTGCRYGELARLIVDDFDSESGTLVVRISKSGKPRHVVLTEEGIAFFSSLVRGREGGEVLLRKTSGSVWGAGHQRRPMSDACSRAAITEVNFHALRHTWASLAVMGGVPVLVVARNLGHADTRMVEKHYGHLAPSYVSEAIKSGAPRFGLR